MLNIRPAKNEGHQRILKILKGIDLYYSSLEIKDFWIAEKNNNIIGCVQVEEYDNFSFLGSLAVIAKERKNGVATQLMNTSIKNTKRNIYLYTIIPEFFKKFNFTVANIYPSNLPSKDRFECEYCQPEKCVTMVRKINAS